MSELFLWQLGWFLFVLLALCLFVWRSMQNKIIKVRISDSLRLESVGFFVREEGFENALQLYKFRFKEYGVAPYHIYSELPWSTVQALYRSDEVMVIEHLYPFLTLRNHELQPNQYFNDPLTSPPLPGFVNIFKRFVYKIVCLIPRINDMAWEWIDRDMTIMTKELKVIESDISEEAIEYLYRVEYEERVLDPDTEEFITREISAELNLDEIEDLETDENVMVHKIEPVYAILIKETDTTAEIEKVLTPKEIKEVEAKENFTIKSKEPAYKVKYFRKDPEDPDEIADSGEIIAKKSEINEMMDIPEIEVASYSKLFTVEVRVTPNTEDPTDVKIKREIMTEEELEEVKQNKAVFKVLHVGDGPFFVMLDYPERRLRKEVNLSKEEIEQLKKREDVVIINIDDIVQARRIRTFKNHPEEAVNRHITYCNSIAVQKMRVRELASRTELLQNKLQKAKEDFYFANVEFSKEKTEQYTKSVQEIKRNDMIIETILDDVLQHQVGNMSPDRIRLMAYRDFLIYNAYMSKGANKQDLKKELAEIKKQIRDISKTKGIPQTQIDLDKALETEFPKALEEE
jgi:hypothetical protein